MDGVVGIILFASPAIAMDPEQLADRDSVVRLIDLDSVIGLSEGREVVVGVGEDVLAGHEVRVTLDAGGAVEPGEHRLQELLLLGRAT